MSTSYKDELACCRRSVYTPELRHEQHVIEEADGQGGWTATPTAESGWDFWNGNLVGGSSNLMSGFFHRLKPVDFRQRTELGPIDYADLEPYYDRVERLIGVSGHVTPRPEPHPAQEPRSTADFPYPPTAEHPISGWIDRACASLDFHALRVPRAILSRPDLGRRASRCRARWARCGSDPASAAPRWRI